MLSLGGVRHLTGGSKQEGNVTCAAMLKLCGSEAVEHDGRRRRDDRGPGRHARPSSTAIVKSACGSAAARPTIGIFAKQWYGHADEVIVVDDHITGVLTEHQAGRFLDMKPAGIRVRGRKSTPGRYFQVAKPGPAGAAPTSSTRSRSSRGSTQKAWPGLRLLMVSTTGEDAAWFVLDDALEPVPAEMPPPVRQVVDRIAENCEPALCTVMFMAGAGGSLRAGITENPVRLTRSVKQALTRVTWAAPRSTSGRAAASPFMVDVTHAGELLRLRADAGARRADRVHAAPRRLCGAWAGTWTRSGGSRTSRGSTD